MRDLASSRELPKPDVLVLDIDNTLYEYEPAHRAGTRAVEAKLQAQYSIRPDEFRASYALARSSVKDRLGQTGASHSRLIYFKSMSEKLGLGAEPSFFLDLEQTYWRNFLTAAELFVGVREFLDEVRMTDVKLYAITDLTTQIQLRKLVYFSLEHLFDGIITSEEAGGDKSTGAPFKLLQSQLSFATTPDFLMVGDCPVSDTLASREHLGARTVQKIHRGVRKGRGSNMADFHVASFVTLAELAAKWR